MAKQEIIHERRRFAVKPSGKNTSLAGRGIVNVPPHVRMVQGKPVLVSGYTYHRK